MVFTRKFSEFPDGGDINEQDRPVGLEAGVNTIWNYIASSGQIIRTIEQDTSALLLGRWVRLDNATGLYVHALANNEENAEVAGVVREIIDGTHFRLQQSGYIPPGTPGFTGFTTNPNIFFLSPTSLGMQTSIEPTTNGYVSKPVFYADSTDSGWVICLMRGDVVGTPAPIPFGGGSGSDSNIVDHAQVNTFSIGNWVTLGSDNTYVLTNPNTFNGSQAVGVVTMTGNPFRIQFAGYNSATVTGAVDQAGAPLAITTPGLYYLSDVTPGAISPFQPTNPLAYSKPVFQSESAINGTGWVLPQRSLAMALADNPNVLTVTQTAHGFLSNGLVVIPKTGLGNVGKYELAQANTYNKSYGVGMIRIIDVDTFTIQEIGYFKNINTVPPVPGGVANPAYPLQNGIPYYLSATQPGQITTLEPSNPNFSKPMFMPDQTNAGWILPMRPNPNGGGPTPPSEVDYINCDDPENIIMVAGVWTDIPCLEVVMTPDSITSKMVLYAKIALSTAVLNTHLFRFTRNGIPIGIGSGPGIAANCRLGNILDLAMLYVDVPGITTPVTYKIQGYSSGNDTWKLNTETGGTSSWVSTLLVEEYA